MKEVKIYGLTTCGHCNRVKGYFDRNSVSYSFIDVKKVAGSMEEAAKLNGGKRTVPTVVIGDNVFINPDDRQLAAALAA